MARVRFGVLFLVVGLLVGSSAFSALASASEPVPYVPDESEFLEPAPAAERPVCPVLPEPAAEGADPSVVEQRDSRIEADETCRVWSQRLEALSERLWWIVSEQLREHVQGVAQLERSAEGDALLGRLEPIAERLGGTLDTEVVAWSGGSLPVEDAAAGETAEGTAQISEAVDAAGESERSALWYLIGVAAGAFVGYLIYRQVMPRA